MPGGQPHQAINGIRCARRDGHAQPSPWLYAAPVRPGARGMLIHKFSAARSRPRGCNQARTGTSAVYTLDGRPHRPHRCHGNPTPLQPQCNTTRRCGCLRYTVHLPPCYWGTYKSEGLAGPWTPVHFAPTPLSCWHCTPNATCTAGAPLPWQPSSHATTTSHYPCRCFLFTGAG